MRVKKKSIDQFKTAMEVFFPKYLEADMNLPKEYSYQIRALFDIISYDVNFTDINYDKPHLDIKDTKMEFVDLMGENVLEFDFPALKEWKISMHQHMNTWILPPDSDVYFEFKDFKTIMQMRFEATEKGYLRPIVYSSLIDFGESMLYHEDWF